VTAVLAERGESAVILVGTSSIMTYPGALDISGNKDLIINMVSYLSVQENVISIAPKSLAGSTLQIPSLQTSMILTAIVLVVMPVAVLAIGYLVIWRRRRL
jgi:ABC-type uncharacterized transport system involved in gliding motility auxiliary subunit